MHKLAVIICLLSHAVFASIHIEIDFVNGAENLKKLPRFWTNSGFSPPVEKVDEYFDSDDVNSNLEIIGSLPNKGISNVRIHWLLNLLSIR